MTVEYLPVGIKCNLKCTYCYQEPMREAGSFSAPLDFIGVKKALDKAGSSFAIFGGEPLLAPISHLEEVWKYGYEKHGSNGIQTNGLLITDAHIDLFRKYKVQVGISIDGPPIINSARCGYEDTLTIIENLRKTMAQVSTSIIITIHRLSYDNLPLLLDFIDVVVAAGMTDINLHNLEVDNRVTDLGLKLTDAENFTVFGAIYDRYKGAKVRINPFADIRELLTKTNPSVSCIWNACDPTTTPAVHGINAAGDLTNCGRTNKSGIDYLKSESSISLERYQALSQTDYADGGCAGCDYFFVCKGQCPGTAINGDWRNRTQDCLFWFALIDYIGRDIPCVQRIKAVDGNRQFLASLGENTEHGDSPHGDSPHGDSHGDFTDGPKPAARVRENQLGLVSS